MELKIGQVVKSVAGHDKGDLLVIAGFEKTKVLVCDGKHRKLEKPKCKNPKHLQATETRTSPLTYSILFTLWLSENYRAILCDCHSMLEMCGKLSVKSFYCPSVGENLNSCSTLIDHRLNSECHAR